MNHFNLFLTVSGGDNAAAAAETVVTNTDAGTPGFWASCAEGGGLGIILVYAAVLGLMYLIFIRPQNKRRAQEEQMRKNVEVGDEVTTIGGICGRVVSIKEDETLVIETGTDRNKMKIKTWAISSNDSARERQAAEAPAEEKKGFFSKFKK